MRRTLLLSFFASTLLACVGAPPPPPGRDDGSSTAGGPVTTDSSTTPGEDTTLGGTGLDTSSSGTTVGVSATDGSTTTGGETTMSVEPTSSSGGPPPECMAPGDCENNETCNEMGECVSVCAAWGMGNYDYCLTDLGTFDSVAICGQAGTCVNAGTPIEATVCGRSCNSLCDCPAPPPLGTATVTCDNFVGDGGNECYLSCEKGETCPDDMICRDNLYCAHSVQPLAMYGNCDGVAAPCIDGECATATNGMITWSVCVSLCPGGVGDCDPAPPGATMGEDCGLVISPPDGPDCHLDCTNDGDCPTGMVCISFGGTPTMCMWP